MTDLWVEASRDLDAESLAHRMAFAKVAAAAVWPFLASAHSPDEFEHRLALSYRQLANAVEPELLDSLVASLRDDYAVLWPVEREAIRPTANNHQASQRARVVPMQFFDRQHGRWVTAAAQETPGNPGAGDPTPEQGPMTGETGTYPVEVAGPDPWNPMNGKLPLPPGTARPPANRFPAEPQPWQSTPESAWREQPMQFSPPRQGARVATNVMATQNPYDPDAQPVAWVHWERMAAASADSLSYADEGTETGPTGGQNPNFFGDGTEGLQSTDGGFPEDVALPEPDERVDMYRGMTTPTVQAPMAGMPPATADYKYVKPNPDGDGWVITQKGTGKVLSHHDSQEEAEASFRAMMQSKHGGSLQQPQFFDPRYAATTNFVDDNPYQDSQDQTEMPISPPDPPQSMTPGGAGAEAMGGASSSTPTSSMPGSSPADPGGADQAAKMSALRMFAEDDYRGRPNPMDPTGVGDDYTANTWENAIKQAPRQQVEDRGANTPQRAAAPIPQNSSSNGGERDEDDDEDDEDRREASLHHYLQAVARRAAQAAVRAA
jgi:hypothetical protein